jgi:Flp pilus assembly protein TadG
MMSRLVAPASVRRERGAAAVELALLLPVLIGVLALVFPIGMMLIEKHRLDRTLSDTIRFASATPNTASYDADARRPTTGAVTRAATRTYEKTGGGTDGFTVDVTPGSKPGDTVSVTLHKEMSLGPFGSLMAAVGVIDSPTVTLSATATGREE